MKSFAVLGLGRFGKELALQLARGGAEVLAIDRERKIVDEVADEVTRAVTANLRDKDALQELGVAECDEVILSVGSDLAASVLAVVNLKALGVKHLVCKAYDEVHRDVLLRLGADQVLIPEQEFAAKLAAQMISPRLRDQIQLTEDYVIEEMAVPESWVGKTLGEMNIRNRFDVTVLTVRHGEKIVPAPGATEKLLAGDVVLLLGEKKAAAAVRKLR